MSLFMTRKPIACGRRRCGNRGEFEKTKPRTLEAKSNMNFSIVKLNPKISRCGKLAAPASLLVFVFACAFAARSAFAAGDVVGKFAPREKDETKPIAVLKSKAAPEDKAI